MAGRDPGKDGAASAANNPITPGDASADPHGETVARTSAEIGKNPVTPMDDEAADPHGKTVATPSGVDPAHPISGPTFVGSTEDLSGQHITERYVLEEKVGQGGMGAVYRAKHTEIGKQVAIKILLEKYAEKDQVVARLRQEARLASSIGHEHIIDITDIGYTNDGRTFVVMEYLEGMSLGQRIAHNGPLERSCAIRIARQVASALAAAHDKDIVHRDIKPENVFLLKRKGLDFAKVVDFGISKAMVNDPENESPRLTQTGMVLGTPLYMSPEQARGDEGLDHRIDIYALGVIMYEMVTGEVPHRGSNYLNVLSQIVTNEVISPSSRRQDLDADFEAVILKAMAKDRDERYQTMEELDADLQILQDDDPSLSTSGVRVSAFRWHKKRQRSKLRLLWYAAGIALLLSAVAVTITMVMPDDASSKDALAAVPVDAAPPPPPADATPAKVVEETVTIEIKSIPAGATVYADDGSRVLGTTPVKHAFVKANKQIPIIAELEGYKTAEVNVNPIEAAKQGVTIRLKKAPKNWKKPPRKPPTAAANKNSNKGSDDTAGGELSGNPFND
jgi:serine/threonine-protein kinase